MSVQWPTGSLAITILIGFGGAAMTFSLLTFILKFRLVKEVRVPFSRRQILTYLLVMWAMHAILIGSLIWYTILT